MDKAPASRPDDFRALLREGPLGYHSLDAEGRIRDVNEAWLELMGYARDEVVGRAIAEFLTPDSVAKLQERFPRFLESGEVRGADFVLVRKDGAHVPIEIDGRIGRRPDGTDPRTHCILHDMTPVKASEQQLRHLFEQAPVSLWLEDFSAVKLFIEELRAQGVSDFADHFTVHPEDLRRCAELVRIVDINEATVRLHRAADRESLLASLPQTFTERSFEAFAVELMALIEGETTSEVEGEVRTLDGEVLTVLARVIVDPQHDDWSRIYVALVDLTHARAAAEANTRLATAVEQAAEIIMVTDTRGRVEYVNPAFERVTGYTREEVLGRDINVLRSGRHPDEYFVDLWRTIAGGATWTGALHNKRKDGSTYEEEATISPVRDTDGQIVSFVAVKRDVTREKELENRLVQSQKLEAVGQLAGGVAHDFNNILQAMMANLQFAMEDTPADDPRRGDLEMLREGMTRAAGLTRQLLAFSRRQVLELQHLDLNELIGRLLTMMHRTIGEHIHLEFHPGALDEPVNADAGQIEQVLVNLCVNARDAMPEGGDLRISTVMVATDDAFLAEHPWARKDTWVLVKVEDTGCGMTAAVREKIFEPFFTTKPTGRGTGLGLATVYGIVKQHEGMILVDTAPAAGSTFRLYLPAARTVPAPDPAGTGDADERPGGTETILLAEDDEAVRLSMARTLERAGYTVVAAADGTEAIAAFATHPARFDLALLDLVMPDLSGIQVRERIREVAPDLPVLFSSGYSRDALGESFQGLESLLLAKPHDPAQLLRRLRSELDAR